MHSVPTWRKSKRPSGDALDARPASPPQEALAADEPDRLIAELSAAIRADPKSVAYRDPTLTVINLNQRCDHPLVRDQIVLDRTKFMKRDFKFIKH